MIKGKPQMVFGGDNILSRGGDARPTTKAKNSVSLKKERDVASKFASYLQTGSTAMPTPTQSPLDSMESNFTEQSIGGKENLFAKPKSGVIAGVSSHFGGRFSIGSEDTREGASPRDLFVRNTQLAKPQGTRVAAGTLNNGINFNQGTMEKALAASATTLRAQSTQQSTKSARTIKATAMGKDVSSASGLDAMKTANASNVGGNSSKRSTALAFQNKKYKSAGSMTFDYTFSSGQETKNLLQAFKKAEITLKSNGVQVAEAPYNRPFVKKSTASLHAKGAAAQGYTGKYANNEVSSSSNGNQQSSGIYSSAKEYTGSLGSLSAKFESGDMGSSAVGYDRHGGTSYGKFQISSRAGTMKNFIGYLKKVAPDLATRLSKAGPSNTGSRNGRMPTEWRAIAKEQPERFEALQNNFIMKSHFEPAMTALTDVGGVNLEGLSPALKEVVFSTAVQHGVSGAAKIIDGAVQRVGVNKLHESLSGEGGVEAEESLIRNIYAIRSNQFGSSSSRVRVAVKNRLRHEMQDALALLKETNTQTIASSSGRSQDVAGSMNLKATYTQTLGLYDTMTQGMRQIS